MLFRKSTEADVGQIMEIVSGAKEFLRAQGLNQWQNGYPNREIFISDARSGVGRAVCDETGAVLAVCAAADDPDPSYAEIDGSWACGAPYMSVHRVAVSASARGARVGTFLFESAEAEARSRGFADLRVDTHEGNRPMRGLVESRGFVYRGIILLASGPEKGQPRVAYEKVLK